MNTVAIAVPSRAQTLGTLLWAEAIAFTRSWRSIIWTVALPVLILVLGARTLPVGAKATLDVVAYALVIGTFSLALMGHAMALATYRERGVFQLLRCTPVPASQLLVARLLVQVMAMLIQGAVVLVAARLVYGVSPTPAAIGLLLPVLLLTGLVALALGQVVAALTKQASSATAVSRVLLIVLFVSQGMMGGTHGWPGWVQTMIGWLPVKAAQELLAAALMKGQIDATGWGQLAALLVWAMILGFVGLRWFQWEAES